MDPCPNEKCEYWLAGNCDYKTIVGYRLPCKPGKNCDFNPERHPGNGEDAKPLKKKPFYNPKQLWNTDLAMELYKAGATEREIVAATGVSQSAVQRWRARNKLPPNKPSRANKKTASDCHPKAADAKSTYANNNI